MPIQYTGISEEHHAVRQRAGVFDVSHMGELEVRGANAVGWVNRLITGDLDKVRDGQALYTCACNEGGTILDDLIVYRRGADDVLVVCNASNREKIATHFARYAESGTQVRDASDEYALLALQGPKAFDVIEAAGGSSDLRSLPSFHFKAATIGSIPCTVARTGYTGEDGVELFVEPGRAEALFVQLLEAGQAFGLAPVGLGARDTLRLESRLSLYGNDIDETTNPLEAGLGWIVKLDKPSDFLGKAALQRIQSEGLKRRLVGFEMVGRGVARHGYPLLGAEGDTPIGICTSGGPSPTLGKSIGLGYVPLGVAAVGSALRVDCRGKHVAAVVVRTPFYKRQRG